jgi:large subunit ribosomal protein L29
MKSAEVRDQHTDDLHLRIAELKEELFNLRFQLATGQLDNHRRIRQVKQDVARIRTILRERDFSAAEAARAGVTGEPVPMAPPETAVDEAAATPAQTQGS